MNDTNKACDWRYGMECIEQSRSLFPVACYQGVEGNRAGIAFA